MTADLDGPFQTALADRYTIERELGRGGMATVYLAHDIRHDRPVALKVLHHELTSALGPERFLREIKIAARLQHPHILSVHDSGEAAGRLWFTMPYVEGESLRDRLRREKQLPVDEAVRITREAAQALDYAHRRGIVHRDVKPENLLLTEDGNTLVADFGIARALGAEAEDGLTQTGMAIGTPAYMSPEQASGERTVDGRTDVYALGAVLYEMLAGEQPYTGPTAQAIIAKRFNDPVPSPRRIRTAVSEAVDVAVQRALAITPADRFGTAADFARALSAPAGTTTITPAGGRIPASGQLANRRRLPTVAIALGAGFLIGLGVLFAWRRGHPGDEVGDGAAKRLAVLPFENLGDSADAYFADGVADEVRGKLAALPGVEVIARASSSQYRRSTKPPREIARELGVRYLLTGTVRWEKRPGADGRVRVSPELVDVTTGTTRWQQPFDAPVADVFGVQADIAARVAEALGVALGSGQRGQLAARPTDNLEAYEAYLMGRQMNDQAGDERRSLLRAVSLLERAVALDPKFALAYAQLAQLQLFMWFRYLDRDTLRVVAGKRAAEEALRLDPALPEAHVALGFYHYHGHLDYEPALEQFFQAERSQPSNPEPLEAIGYIRRRQGRWEEALDYFKRVEQMDPRSVTARSDVGDIYFQLRRYGEALAWYDSTAAVANLPVSVRVIQALSYLGSDGDLNRFRLALPNLGDTPVLTGTFGLITGLGELALLLSPDQQTLLLSVRPEEYSNDTTGLSLAKALVYRSRGDSAKARLEFETARAVLERRLRRLPDDAVFHGQLGLALAGLGRAEEAVREGMRGVALRPPDKDATEGPGLVANLARIDVLVGRLDGAIDQLETVLSRPGPLSRAWLRVDPMFAPLRGNPRFERLVRGP